MIVRQPNTQYVLSLSYGKDSLATLEAIRLLGYPLDRIIHAEIWATDTVQADLPPMVEFKAHADRIIKERYGIEVEHLCAMKDGEKLTYEKMFYHKPVRRAKRERERVPNQRLSDQTMPVVRGRTQTTSHTKDFLSPEERGAKSSKPKRRSGSIYGFPYTGTAGGGGWAGVTDSKSAVFSSKHLSSGADINTVMYLGIAADEPIRIERHKANNVLPLVDIGWDEAYCRKWCEDNDLLSPIYRDTARGGCWFCHNQGVDQLRLLRKNYPELWRLLLKWDLDSPVTFHSDGHTVHDFDKRFAAEDLGLIQPGDRRFRWKQVLTEEE